MAHLRQVDDDVAQATAVQDKDARPRGVVWVGRVGRLGADEEGALDAGLVPVLGDAVKGVDDGVGGDAEDAVDGGHVALEHGDVELGVGARGRGLVVRGRGGAAGGRGVGLVVGDGGYEVGGLALVPGGLAWCCAAHGAGLWW